MQGDGRVAGGLERVALVFVFTADVTQTRDGVVEFALATATGGREKTQGDDCEGGDAEDEDESVRVRRPLVAVVVITAQCVQLETVDWTQTVRKARDRQTELVQRIRTQLRERVTAHVRTQRHLLRFRSRSRLVIRDDVITRRQRRLRAVPRHTDGAARPLLPVLSLCM